MKKAILFPGYGSQYVGMAKELYDESRIMQEYFEEAANCLDTNFVKLCFASSDSDVTQAPAAYTSIFLVSCSIYSLIKDRGIVADLVAGYNTGEYAVLYASGSITFPDGLYLLNKLAQQYQSFLETADVATMRVDGLSTDELQKICKKVSKKGAQVTIGIYQADTVHIVSGHRVAIDELRLKVCEQETVNCFDPGLQVGLHSSLMNPVIDQFKMYLEKVDFKDPVIACMDSQARLLATGEQVKENVIDSIHMPIYWNRVLDSLVGYDMIIQVGPGDQLSALAKEKYPDKLIITVQTRQDFEELTPYLSKDESDTETP